jgi:hypothetical protein
MGQFMGQDVGFAPLAHPVQAAFLSDHFGIQVFSLQRGFKADLTIRIDSTDRILFHNQPRYKATFTGRDKV